MVKSTSRREFLASAVRTAGGLAVLGGAGGLLDACGGSAAPKTQAQAPKPGGSSATSGLVTGRTTATPKRGGVLKCGLISDFNSFNPLVGQFDQSGTVYAATVFDALLGTDGQGNVVPNLAQSFTPNHDYTTFTIKARSGVMFHDGTPCTAKEIAMNLEAQKASPLNALSLADLESVTQTGSDTVVLKTKIPWVAFGYYLTGQLGFIASPKTLTSATGGSHPVGTGPFVFSEWVPQAHFYANRNPHYWRNGLPYVDRVEYSTISNDQSRQDALLSGTVDLIISSNSINLHELKDNSSVVYVTDQNSVAEPSYDCSMVNCAVAPTNDLRVRQALAYSVSGPDYEASQNFGLYPFETGPFPPGSKYYARPATGSNTYNLAKAKELVKSYEAEHGKLVVTYQTVNDPQDGQIAQYLQQKYALAGITVKINQVEQVELISNCLSGHYQVSGWSQFAANNPDENYVWWSTQTIAPVGTECDNMARNSDPIIQANMAKGRSALDPQEAVDAYKTVGLRLNHDLPYLWGNRTVYACYAKPTVKNFNGANLPSGQPALSFTNGFFYPSSTWLTTA